ncbi:bacteriocin [Tistrella mobilis]|uniref:bacteriocin n=1 Tax=Tistrella mobilis TaxID=171437 RepID=UPI00355763FB
MSENNSQISYEEFNYWVGHLSTVFDSLADASASLPTWSVEEVAAIRSAFSLASRMTLTPAQYYATYQEDGIRGVLAAYATNTATSYAMEAATSWAVASASAMGLSAGASLMVGLGTGVIVGVGISYGIDWATGGNLTGSIADMVGYLNDYTRSQDGPIRLSDGTILLPEIIVTPNEDFAALEEARDLLNGLNADIGTFNSLFERYGVEFDAHELIQMEGNDFDFTTAMEMMERTLVDLSKSPQDYKDTLNAANNIFESMKKLADLYESKKDIFDAIKPEFGEQLKKALDNVGDFMRESAEHMTPLVLDLNGDGLHTISMLDSDADFDFGDGNTNAHGWLSAEDGFLAVDRNGNGRIDDLSELFGSRDRDGFSILADHDDNMDGVIDAADAIFADLKVWMDIDGDGTSQAGEITGLSTHGITAIRLDARLQDIDDQGNWLPLSGSFLRDDGSFGDIADVYFARLRSNPDQPMDVVTSSRVVLGGRHDDRLEGSNTDQIFLGGRGRDVFVWETGQGHDVIADFTAHGPEADIIDLTRTNLRKLEDVRRKLIDTDSDVTLALDDTGSLSLLNIRISDLSAANFMFA